MADTIRAHSAIQVLFANNTAQAISEQDLRDFVESVLGVLPIAAKSTDYTLTEDDVVIIGTAGVGGITLTLPTHATARAGKIYVIVNYDGGAGGITISGDVNVNGAASKTNNTQYQIAFIVREASEWLMATMTAA